MLLTLIFTITHIIHDYNLKISYDVSMERGVFFITALCALGLWVNTAQASELTYTKIIETRPDTIIFQHGGLENAPYFSCAFTSLECTNIGTTSPKATTTPPKSTVTIKDDRYSKVVTSPTGRYIAYYKYAVNGQREFKLIDKTKNKTYTVKSRVNFWDLLIEEPKLFSFSPDESKMVYLDDRDGYPALYLVNLETLAKTGFQGEILNAKKYSVVDFLLWDKNTLYFIANRDNPLLWTLYKYDFTTKEVTKVIDRVSYGNSMRRVGDHLLFLRIENNEIIPLLYSEAKGIERFPTFGPSLISTATSTPPLIERKTLGVAGMSGVILRPAQATATSTHPILIWLHGGPFRQTSIDRHSFISYGVYDWMLDELVKKGAVVIKLDYRGSYGYGRVFSESIKNNVGKGDVRDIVEATKKIKEKIPNNGVYLIGNSYGGYLSLRTIVDRPDIFTGAVSINGVTDWSTLLTDLRTSIFNIHFNGIPKKANSLLYSQASVINRIFALKANPILLIHGEKDTTITVDQSKLLHNELLKKKKKSELVIYEGEDHVFAKESTMEDMCQRLMKFFLLKTDPADTTTCKLK